MLFYPPAVPICIGTAAKPQIEFCGGNYTGFVPPVPISNTEVKYSKADDSAMSAKVGSCHLSPQSPNTESFGSLFVILAAAV